MVRAVYVFNEPSGKWILVAAFHVAMMPGAPSNWPQEIAEWYKSQGRRVKSKCVKLEDLKLNI